MLDFLSTFWGKVIAIAAGITTLVAFYEKFLKPRMKRAKLKRLYELIRDWYDFLYINLDKGIDMDVLDHKEKKITEFIRDNLRNKWMYITSYDRRTFLKFCGIKKELRDNPELFMKFSRCPAIDKIPVDTFWQLTCNAFYDFHRGYPNKVTVDNSLANVEMRIKFLKSYLNIKSK